MARRRRRSALGGHPELRMAYGARARPLGCAILDLLPPPPESDAPCSACTAAGAGWLLCRRWAHLIREDDPVAYRRLVTRAACALDPAAPPPPRYSLGNSGHSQAKIVGVTMKIMMLPNVKPPTSSAMVAVRLARLKTFFLLHPGIFSCRERTYLQVTGLPIISLLKKRMIQQSISKSTDEFQGPMESARKKCPMCYLWRDAAMAHNNLSRVISSKSAVNTHEQH